VTTRLFVYGTLRRQHAHEMFHLLARHATFIGEGTVAGRLFDLGRYPGMVKSPAEASAPQIAGELYEIAADHWPAVIAQLDAYEGAEYVREQMTVETAAGSTEAWVYVLNRSTDGLPEIATWPPQ
jgi:gamma-glutamylcyclotransferase (GGCT)/AIG2-like uncharacterized protein YtfP